MQERKSFFISFRVAFRVGIEIDVDVTPIRYQSLPEKDCHQAEAEEGDRGAGGRVQDQDPEYLQELHYLLHGGNPV